MDELGATDHVGCGEQVMCEFRCLVVGWARLDVNPAAESLDVDQDDRILVEPPVRAIAPIRDWHTPDELISNSSRDAVT